jgi:hypothetical protein
MFAVIAVAGVWDPDGDPMTTAITGITQDEPIDSEDSGNPCPDGAVVGTSLALIRVERKGGGDGRMYHIAFLADDGRGGQCTGAVTVCVPPNQKNDPNCVDEGTLFDSTQSLCTTAKCDGTCALELDASSACAGDTVPLVLSRELARARLLLIRAAETTHVRKANRLVAKAMRSFRRAARIAATGGIRGTVSSGCVQSLEAMVAEAEARLAR